MTGKCTKSWCHVWLLQTMFPLAEQSFWSSAGRMEHAATHELETSEI